MKVKVYVDGSKHPDKNICGYGFVVKVTNNPYKKDFKFGSSFKDGTVLEAESKAIYEALKYVKNHFSKKDKIEIFSDNAIVRSYFYGKPRVLQNYSTNTIKYLKESSKMMDKNIKVKKIYSSRNTAAHNLANKYRSLAEGKRELAYQYQI
jgi:ribonuclease HI